MLKKLSVENYALIEKLDLDLSDSLNIITGETGAGKSILLGALGLLLGNRSDFNTLKDTEKNLIVEGIFEIKDYGLEELFTANDLEYGEQTVIRRVITPSGKSRAYVNDLPVQQTVMKDIGRRLIDIHSQHQSLMLADEDFRTAILDGVSSSGRLMDEYREAYGDLNAARRELDKVKRESEQSRQDQEWLEFQVGQLKDAALREGEQEELEAEQSELSHAEEIKEVLLCASSSLDEDETGILARLRQAVHSVSGISKYYAKGEQMAERLQSALIELKDMERELSDEQQRVFSDPAKLRQVDERLATLYALQQKHRVSDVAQLIAVRCGFEEKLNAITGSDEAIAALERRVADLHEKAVSLAAAITERRRKAAGEVLAYVGNMLAELGMPFSRLQVEITPSDGLRASGADNIRFLFSANRNIEPAAVEKIASGGEMSRLMLALKSMVARSMKLPTIIFDEIDTGVSGIIADAMGNIIRDLSQTMQVVNITHLPQVASKGDTHFYVYKDDGGSRTQTMIARLTPEQRVAEIAKMLSGSSVTEAATEQARLLLGYK